MSVRVVERHDSRQLSPSISDPRASFHYIVTGSTDEQAVYAAILAASPLLYLGLWRSDASLSPQGGGVWDCTVEYRAAQSGGGGAGGGSGPLGGEGGETPGQGGSTPEEPSQPPPSETAALGGEFGFTTTGGTQTLTHARKHIESWGLNGAAARDCQGTIGLTADGKIEGVEVVSPKLEWSVTKVFRFITLNYVVRLMRATGKTNDRKWYGYERGELLFLGADGQYRGQGPDDASWSITFKFAAAPNESLTINDDLPGPGNTIEKKGWEHLWVAYKTSKSNNKGVEIPFEAHLEQVYDETDFRDLGIG